MNTDKKDEIKKALLQGGLVVAARCSGKTMALAEILFEDPQAVVICPTERQMTRISKLLKSIAPDSTFEGRIIFGKKQIDLSLTIDKNVYVDEFRLNKYEGVWKSAVTSYHYPVKVIL